MFESIMAILKQYFTDAKPVTIFKCASEIVALVFKPEKK